MMGCLCNPIKVFLNKTNYTPKNTKSHVQIPNPFHEKNKNTFEILIISKRMIYDHGPSHGYLLYTMQNILHQSCPYSVNSQMNILKFNYLSLYVVPIECCLKIKI
jgi:hypothetical protein